MKLFLFLILCFPAINAALSAYERKKLIDELNFDRVVVGKKLGMSFGRLSYNITLEKQLDNIEICDFSLNNGPAIIPLEYDEVAKEFFERIDEKHDQGSVKGLFNLDSYSIGCSKAYECSHKLLEGADVPPEFVGKTLEYRGACVTTSNLTYMSAENKKSHTLDCCQIRGSMEKLLG
ncbi:unnamed protein product [Caenorhabditis brenneri]